MPYVNLNHHQLKAGGLTIGGLNRRLEEKAAGSRWFAPRAERPSGGLKPPTDNQNHSRRRNQGTEGGADCRCHAVTGRRFGKESEHHRGRHRRGGYG